MSRLKKPIDFKTLENELDEALKADELYKLQNDAKIRAIEQRVPTYEHFRGMVLAAHLQPLRRSELQKKPEVSWNHYYNNKSIEDTFLKSERSNFVLDSKHSKDILKEPRNGAEFVKVWENLSDVEEKFDYLVRFRDNLKDKFFKVEVPSEFLEKFFKLSLEVCSMDKLSRIVDLLQILSECNRLSLSLAMISAPGKSNVQGLFDKLTSLTDKPEEVDNLERLKENFILL